MVRVARHGALREVISVAVLWYEDELLARDQGDAVNVVRGVLLGGRQYRAADDLWNLRDHSVAALLQAVCPFGNPIAHSYVAGLIRPVSPALYTTVAPLGEFRRSCEGQGVPMEDRSRKSLASGVGNHPDPHSRVRGPHEGSEDKR